ncbi:carbohydrate-binding module family 63 protein [Diplocarpon rosae]|nr:carbohydrate-binding module family 63 protein [Diplocarpon rosae]
MQLSRSSIALAFASGAAALTGEATFYGGNVAGGHCSLKSYTLPAGLFGTALGNWENSANCGRCVSVTGPNGKAITAQVVDECPNCGTNHLDLFPDAFAALADPSAGVIPIDWQYVDCPITTPLELHNKEGVSAHWFSLQVVNQNKGVTKLEVSTDGGNTWTLTDRQKYNFFENPSGFGTTSVSVRVTSVDGDTVVVDNVEVAPGVSVTAPSNFPLTGSNVEKEAAPVASSPVPSSPAVAPQYSVYSGLPLVPTSTAPRTSTKRHTTTLTIARTITRTIWRSTTKPAPASPTPSTSSSFSSFSRSPSLSPSSSSYVPTSLSGPSNTTSSHPVPTYAPVHTTSSLAPTTSAPSNTTSYRALGIANFTSSSSSSSSSSSVSVSVVTITSCIPTVFYSTVPIASVPVPSASGAIYTSPVALEHNLTYPAASAVPTFVNGASSLQSPALFAMVVGLAALII